MKKMTTLFLAPLVIGMAIAIFGLDSISHEGFTFWQWCLAVWAVVVIGVLIGASLNLAVFAPVYWLLGRLQFKRTDTCKTHEQKS